jgi:DNA-binding transcriptional LysR family regulator
MAIEFELRRLRSALALEDHRNFARAAEACQMSQPSLSRNIQAIERVIGTKLFDRAVGGVVPTPAGIIFLSQAREMVARSADLSREMDLLRGIEKGELAIGAGTYPSVTIVDQAIMHLVQNHPAVRLHIKVDNRERLLPLVKSRELDMAIVVLDGLGEDPDLHVTRLNHHQGYFVVRSDHPLVTSNQPPTLQSILQFSLIMTSRLPAAMLKRYLKATFGDEPVPQSIKSIPAIACESVATMKIILKGTDAIALLPLNSVMAEVKSGELAILPLVAPFFQAEFGVARMAHRSLSPVGETFLRLLKEEDARILDFEKSAAAELFGPASRAPTRSNRADAPKNSKKITSKRNYDSRVSS